MYQIIKDCKTEYQIIIPANATPVEQTAAEELGQYLKKTYHTELPIREESASDKCANVRAIYVGHTDFARDAGILGTSKENWIVKMQSGNLVLSGGITKNDRGILYAVYHFLEDVVGIRWWNVYEEYIPADTSLSVKADLFMTGTPAFPYRKILHDCGLKNFYYEARNRNNVLSELDDNLEGAICHPSIKKLGGAIQMGRPHHVHTMSQLFPTADFFKEHPDWFALSAADNARIDYGMYCLSNEDLLDATLEKILAYAKEDLAQAERNGTEPPDFYSVTMPDNPFFCECEQCRAQIERSGNMGYILHFVNKIARAVAQKYPTVKIETLVYLNYMEPPKDGTLPEKNVVIRFAHSMIDLIHDTHDRGNERYLRLLKQWGDICRQAGCTYYVWEYMYHLWFDIPMPIAYRLADTFRTFYECGITGVFVENECLSADMWELTQFILLHLDENPYADEEALIDDFMPRFYGPAAEYVKAYLLELKRAATENDYGVFVPRESVHFNYLDAAAVKNGMTLLEKAMESVSGDPILAPRVRYIKTILGATLLIKYFDLKRMANRLGDTFDFDREKLLCEVIDGLKAAKELPRFAGRGSHKIDAEIKFFEGFVIADEEIPPLPAELSHVDPEDAYQFLFKNTSRHIYGGAFVVDDPEACTKKALFYDPDIVSGFIRSSISPTSRYAKNKRPISALMEHDQMIEDETEHTDLYLEDLVPEKYHLYKLGSASDIQSFGNTSLVFFGEEAISLSGVSVVFPMDACDVYFSMKFQGAKYGGDPNKKDALYLDRIIVVRK